MQGVKFEYFKGIEAAQYSFYRVPKLLFTAECFRCLSCEAKILYGLMLDRMSLSIKNRWFDESDRVYIIFTVEEIMELLGCGRQKAVKSIAELDVKKGIGLIEKKRLGLGKPNVIFVKNFIPIKMDEQDLNEDGVDKCHKNFQKYENHTSGSLNIDDQNALKGHGGMTPVDDRVDDDMQEEKVTAFQKYENHTSGSLKNGLLEVPKSNCINTDINKTESNKTDNCDISVSISSYPIVEDIDMMQKADIYRDIIRGNIFYDGFSKGRHAAQVEELVELMVEVMLMPDAGTLRIAGMEKPVRIVKNRLMKFGQMHMEYVLECLAKNTSRIGNIRAYLLTVLYNAPATMDCYYQAEVNRDMYSGCQISDADVLSNPGSAAAWGT